MANYSEAYTGNREHNNFLALGNKTLLYERPHLFALWRTLFSLIGMFIFVANGTVLLVMFLAPSLRRRPRIFLILTMAIADTMLGMYIFLSNLVFIFYLDMSTSITCIVEKIVAYSLYYITILHILLINVEKYAATSFKKLNVFHGLKKTLFVVLVWVFSWSSMSLTFFVFKKPKGLDAVQSCLTADVYLSKAKYVGVIISCLMLPCCCIIIILYSLTLRRLNHLLKQVKDTHIRNMQQTTNIIQQRTDVQSSSSDKSNCHCYDKQGRNVDEHKVHTELIQCLNNSTGINKVKTRKQNEIGDSEFFGGRRISEHRVNNLQSAFYTTQRILIIMFVFVVPIIFYNFMIIFVELPHVVDSFCHMMAVLNSAFNPFVYAWLLKDFRRRLKTLLSQIHGNHRQNTTRSN